MDAKKKKYLYLFLFVILYLGIIWINHSWFSDTKSLQASTNTESTSQYSTEDEKKKVALTFDDGPGPFTEKLLEGLKARNVSATFFVMGKNAEQYPNLIKRMQEDGHQIGNHTYNHVQLNVIPEAEAFAEVEKTNEVLKTLTGDVPDFIRPPYGEYCQSLKRELDMFVALWDVDPLDWCCQNSSHVVDYVLKYVKEGDIILLHDVFETSVDAAFQIVDELLKQGYEFVTVEELLLHF